ncbi:MAG: F0F1 ATP synthase subunit alpha [Clostridium sp.]|uniref:F0F1 ATP synthase subunit alpha n=1 Tax=Clostridium sp. TaxID=1506 RepID=UPI003EE81BAF
MHIKADEITSLIKDEVLKYDRYLQTVDSGTIISIGDGVAKVYGLDECIEGEILEFPNGVLGMALNLDEDNVGCVLLGAEEGINEGDDVIRTGKVMEVPVGEGLLGRVVNSLGVSIDGKGEIKNSGFRKIEEKAPSIIKRSSVNEPLQTGIKAIDSMIPIGKGQRELIIGDRQTGKTSIAIDTILNQKNKKVVCIYVAIGQKQSTVASLVNRLEKLGAMEYTIVVSASASEGAPLQYIAPYTGCAMGEYFMEKGLDALVIYDDLSKHAVAYRTMALLLKRPPGREAYPGDVFYIHSRLLERGAKLSKKYGGGSLTALPIVETLGGDVSSYIPTNIISITDGQIFLDSELFYSGQKPAVNAGISVSRVGGNAQIKAMKEVSGTLRLELAQYRELEAFSKFGTDLDEDTKNRLEKGKRLVEILKQDILEPLDVYNQIILFYTAINNYLEDIDIKEIRKFENEFLKYIETSEILLLELLKKEKKLTDEIRIDLDEAIKSFKSSFFEK